jgi:hypothetical protein
MAKSIEHTEAVWHRQQRPWSYTREQRCSKRLPLPLPISVQVGPEERQAFCRNVGSNSLGVRLPGSQLNIGQKVGVRLYIAGQALDAPAWVLRTGEVTGLRCPDALRVYMLLGGELPPLT